MSAAVHTTIDVLESELARVRSALQDVPLQYVVLDEDATAGALATHKRNLIGFDHDFFSGNQQLTPKELGLVEVQEVIPTPFEEKTIELSPPTNLIDILSNNVVLHHLAPLMSISSLLSLASTCNTARFIIYNTPYVFRHLDLSTCQGALLPSKGAATDVSDDMQTEDQFYSAPLRGIFDRLEKQSILSSVRTLVLDGLPVTADLIADILLTDRFNINILSIRDCLHLNEQKLMQTIAYAVRPSRPAGTPKVKGIYHFTSKAYNGEPQWGQRLSSRREWWKTRDSLSPRSSGSTTPILSDAEDDLNEWYRPSGQLLRGSTEDGWAQIIRKCEGIIAFDAVLCRGPRHNAELYSSTNTSKPRPEERMLAPAIATVSLGPRGCDCCRTSPEGPAIWGESPEYCFPLLNPVPLHTSNVLEAKRPVPKNESAVMIASCMECLKNRWCHRCNKWFCFSCLPSPVEAGTRLSPHQTVIRRRGSQASGQSTPKLGPGVSKDCWECGPTCASCKVDRQLSCSSCFGEYCFEHNDGCSTTQCDWCNISSRRLGRNVL
ncbi:hypothetical protein BGW36DRAFT_306707 [Talaromyces proteolyticus]|uniref:Uncharacterized protein n=1 Tax=Talaromyces proteolyticus TaxID=1131652 RepID=A0AAD4PVQ9_9EURO|nr:uncharacterized protein BGW36DRAFT_306707 [Talaromyces proteolyticus]KAH8690968.1 hypothetical protein BGW36DRAFT_306707 [Talaromyces proteolyticus]